MDILYVFGKVLNLFWFNCWSGSGQALKILVCLVWLKVFSRGAHYFTFIFDKSLFLNTLRLTEKPIVWTLASQYTFQYQVPLVLSLFPSLVWLCWHVFYRNTPPHLLLSNFHPRVSCCWVIFTGPFRCFLSCTSSQNPQIVHSSSATTQVQPNHEFFKHTSTSAL